MAELLKLAEELDFYLYLDDAHGTTILGERGEGAVLSQLPGPFPQRLFLSFSLTKGFGAAGGGILVPDRARESLVRTYGQIYAFSAPLDFASVNACLTVLKLHRDGSVARLRRELHERVALYDRLMDVDQPFSPIRMVKIGDEQLAIRCGRQLLESGYFVSVAFFPIVPKGHAQLRICLASNHTPEEIVALTNAIHRIVPRIERFGDPVVDAELRLAKGSE